MLNRILNHRYPILYRGKKRRFVNFFRQNFTQRKWFMYLYHRLFGHRMLNKKSGYDWCEYCNVHQELYCEPLFVTHYLPNES